MTPILQQESWTTCIPFLALVDIDLFCLLRCPHRSSLFLSTFISMAFGGACLGHNLTGRSTGLVVAGSTWIGGLATLLEKKSRRMELALYVLSR